MGGCRAALRWALSDRTALLLTANRPELIRKHLRELKGELVADYCHQVACRAYVYGLQAQMAGGQGVLMSSPAPPEGRFPLDRREGVGRHATRFPWDALEAQNILPYLQFDTNIVTLRSSAKIAAVFFLQ